MKVENADQQRELERLREEIACLHTSEARHRAILDSQTELICRFTPDTTLTYVNDAYCRFFQKTREALLGVPFLTLIPEEFHEGVLQRICSLQSLKGEDNAFVHEHEVFLPDGSIGWQEWVNRALHDADGNLLELQAVGRDITDRKRAELERKARGERHHQAFGAGEVGAWEWDIVTNHVHWSENTSILFGLPLGAFEGDNRAFWDRVHPEDHATIDDVVLRTLAEGGSFHIRYRAVLPDGTIRWHEAQGELFRDDAGQPHYLTGVVQDITERKCAEEVLAASETRLRTILDSEPECVKLLDEEGRLIDMNRAGLEMIEADSLQDVVGAEVCSLVLPEYREAFLRLHHQAFVGISGTLAFEIVGLKGTYRWLESRTAPLRDTSGKIIAALSVTRDITEPKRVAEALRKREETARHFSEQLKKLHALSIELSRSETLNTLCYLAVERGRKDLGFDRCSVWLYNDDNTQLLATYGTDESGETRCEQGQVWEIRTPWLLEFQDNAVPVNIRYDVPLRNHRSEEVGSQGWNAIVALRDGASLIGILAVDNLLYGAPLQENQIELLGLYGSILGHLCARKKTAEALKESQERMSAVIEAAMDAMVTIDEERRIVVFNQAAETIFGCKADEVIGQSMERFLPERFRSLHPNHIYHFGQTERTNRTMRERGVLTALRADGREFPIEASISQVEVQGKKLYTVILRDISERLELEKQLLQSQKMEGIGRLAGGVAHDFNNLLTAIIGYTELAEDSLPADSEVRTFLEPIHKAADRAANLTAQLLAFARKQMIAPKVVCLNDLTLDVDKLLRRLIGEDIELITRTAPGLGRVKVDISQFEQVIVNLAVNARDAMPQGGKLILETANVHLDDETAPLSPDVSPGEYVMLSVRDTGLGMDEETKKHLFEPFFTTKEIGKGTGLGLATCHGIVKQAGGHIQIDSEPGKGATFRIYLPRVEQEAEKTSLFEAAAPACGTETLLVVEDEPMVRDMTVTTLRAQGYTVLEAETGDMALRRAQEHPGEIDLLVTDVVMPQMSGRQLAEHLERIRPGIKVLYLSGYTEDAIVQHNVINTDVAFLQKPFTPTALAKKVRETLTEPR